MTTIVFGDWTAGGDSFRESAWARVYASIDDVPKYGNSQADTTLTLVEYVYMNGEFYSNDSNYHLQAVGSQAVRDMYAKIAVGYNTIIRASWWNGNYWVWENPSFEFGADISLGMGVGYGPLSAGASLSLAYEEGAYLKKIRHQVSHMK